MSYPHGYWELTLFLTSIFSLFPHFSTYVAGDIPDNVDVPPVAAQVHYGDGFRGFNSVEIMNDSEPYKIARALQMPASMDNCYYYLFLQYVSLLYNLHDILIAVFLGRRKLWVH